MIKPFSPISMAERDKLAASVVRALEEVRECDLENIDLFLGAGIYALYYVGPFPAYSQLAESNLQHCVEPIYVGKAEPSGSRRGISTETRTVTLYKRLVEHGRSINATENLKLTDFRVRFLVMDDEWVRFGESAIIRRYVPVWNAVLDGFGNHDPGSGRSNSVRSKWDTLHPGRPWADKLRPNPESANVLSREVAEYLKSLPPRQSITMNRERSLHTKSEILSSISRSSKNRRRL